MLSLTVCAADQGTSIVYQVRIDTTAFIGREVQLRFDLTSSDESKSAEDSDLVQIRGYNYDAVPKSYQNIPPGHQSFGGPVELPLSGRGRKYTDVDIYSSGELSNGVTFDFDSLGTFIEFSFQTFDRVNNAEHPSQFSVYLFNLDDDLEPDTPCVETSDPLGTNAVLSLEISDGGSPLEVFGPAVFTPPDSVFLKL